MLQTPQIVAIKAFDPKYSYELEFIYEDTQIVRNRLVILNNNDGTTVYDNIQSALKTSHIIPPNTLSPGMSYTAQVQVFDSNNDSSDLSESVLFFCYSTPLFFISDLPEIVRKSVLEIQLNYSQEEGESLRDYQFFLYNYDSSIEVTSEIFYNTPTPYSFYNLKNESVYYVRAIGHTTHGMTLDTGMILFNVEYVKIPANVIFKVENNYKNGYITLQSGIIDIGYELENDNYLIKDGALELWDNKLTYNKGFSIDSDFILQLDAKKIPLDINFLSLNDTVSVCIKEICGAYYACLTGLYASQYVELPKARIIDNDENYILTSDGYAIQIVNTDYEDDEFVIFEIKRVKGIYGLDVYYKSDVYGKYVE